MSKYEVCVRAHKPREMDKQAKRAVWTVLVEGGFCV